MLMMFYGIESFLFKLHAIKVFAFNTKYLYVK